MVPLRPVSRQPFGRIQSQPTFVSLTFCVLYCLRKRQSSVTSMQLEAAMTIQTVEAVYEQGTFRLVQSPAVPFQEG
jgi:hypothetical protein